MKTYQVDQNGYYGEFGGAYIPEILHQCVENLRENYLKVMESDSFKQEFTQLLRDYVGRPSPLYYAKRLSEKYGCKIYLKREDLNHTGAHKINNTIGQILIARRMGKKRIIAETGAGQHGVATATVCALMNMECVVYMGKTDVERQHANVQKIGVLEIHWHITVVICIEMLMIIIVQVIMEMDILIALRQNLITLLMQLQGYLIILLSIEHYIRLIFGDTVTLSLLVPEELTASFQADMIELTNGEISVQVGALQYADFAAVADRLP